MNKRRSLALLLGLALVVTLAGCRSAGEAQPSPSPTPGAESPSPTPTADPGVVNVCLGGEPGSMDPAISSDHSGHTLLAHVFEGLMKWAPGEDRGDELSSARLVPGMAESYERVEGENGGAVYTFHLRPGKWSDGKSVTAQDFVYAWQRSVGGGSSVPYGDLLSCVQGAQAVWSGQAQPADLGVRAVDDTTFEVTLIQDAPWFLELCALPLTAPLRQDAVEEGGSQWTYDPATYLTNGPYRLVSWSHNDQLRLEKNPEYYEEAAGPDRLTFLLQEDETALRSAWEAGSLDLVRGLAAQEGETLKTAPSMTSYYLVFQTQKAPFDRVEVRQAFALAMDREKVVEAAGGGGYTPAGALVPTGVRQGDGSDFRAAGGGYLDPENTAANCDRARSLLAQAGYPGGEGFPEVEYLCPDSPVHKAVAEALRQTWQEELGVSVTVKAQEWGSFLASSHQGEFSIARGRWSADYSDPLSFLELWASGAEGNDGGYASEGYDALLERAAHEADPARRMEALHQAEQRLVGTDWALAPVYFETQSYLAAHGLRGVSYTPQGGFLFTACQKK